MTPVVKYCIILNVLIVKSLTSINVLMVKSLKSVTYRDSFKRAVGEVAKEYNLPRRF